jgi:hypothetical protein
LHDFIKFPVGIVVWFGAGHRQTGINLPSIRQSNLLPTDAAYSRSIASMQAAGKTNLMANGVERIMPLFFLFGLHE